MRRAWTISWFGTTRQCKAGLRALMNLREVLTSFGFLAIPPPGKTGSSFRNVFSKEMCQAVFSAFES
ncbi:MAG TPA: hypothetical protein VM656_02355, partial [Pyrinomonadaceae bacterium]|nr:hypothetical protein [Pyrinomonadaceae bacterium]